MAPLALAPINTIQQFIKQIESYSNPKALNTYYDNSWHSLSTEEMLNQVKYLALALLKHGIKKGDRVGIISVPTSRWVICDLAIMSIGAVTIPLFANISEENFIYQIAEAGVKTVFVSGDEPWLRYEYDRNLFKLAVSLDDLDVRQGTIAYNDMLAQGGEINQNDPNLWQKHLDTLAPEDLATIIYTSGSTGIPKGVEHTFSSLLSLINSSTTLPWESNDRYLNVLPLAHITGRVLMHIMLVWNISLYFFNDIKNMGAACREIHPTVMTVVPRILEKVYTKMVTAVDSAGYLKRAIGHWAFNLANQETETVWKHLFHPLAERLVYHQLREALGGALRILISGGAPLDPHLCHFFRDIGFPVYEGWGLTEITPISVNRPEKTKVGTVGLPLDGLLVKTSPIGELLVKGPRLMRGYLNDPEGTAEAIDSEGWFHTGDKGTIDEDGFITIVGRIKELLKTSTGKMIAPVPIEHALCKAPFIETAIVIAEKKKFTSCLLVPDFEVLKTLKTKQNSKELSDEEFINSPFIQNATQQLIDNVNQHLNHWEQIRAFRYILNPLSVAKNELTPSMKVIRENISNNYKGLIDSIYGEEAS